MEVPISESAEVSVTQARVSDNGFDASHSFSSRGREISDQLALASPLNRFLGKARRRHVLNLVIAEFGIAASAALIGAIVLIITGTQALDWYWPLVLLIIAALIGIPRLRHRVPSNYRLAQEIDARLGLADALSTALHFSSPGAKHRSWMADKQANKANEVAESLDVSAAVPLAIPRSLIVMSALLLTAGGLFTTRYLLTDSLQLTRPMVAFNFNPFHKPQAEREKSAASRKSVIQEQLEKQMQELGIPADDQKLFSSDNPLAMKAASALATPEGKEPMSSTEQGQGIGKNTSDQGSENAETEQSQSASAGNGKQEQGDSKNGNTAAQNRPPNGQMGANSGRNNESLANKMRDAMAGLLSKLKSGHNENQDSSQQNDASSARQQSASQKGMQGQGKSQAQGQGNQNQANEQPGDGADKSQAAQAHAKAADKPGNQDSKSGIGHSDGNKEAREAEQLAAMGKISEILGKRSQQVAGEMSVEVASGNQQLKTAYMNKHAQHTDAGAELDRDEIPLAYQSYVQKYFEEVHKAGAPQPKPAAKSKSHPPQRTNPEPIVTGDTSGQ